MNKQNCVSIALAVAISIAITQCPAVATTVTVGAPAIDRTYADNAVGSTYLDPGRPISITGYVTEWDLWAGNAVPVKLQAFKPVTTGYMLMGENTVTIPHTGLCTFSVPEGQQFLVQPGWIVGFRTVNSTQAVKFDIDSGSHQFSWPESSSTDVGVGGIIAYSWFQGGRTYSLSATVDDARIVTVPEPATISILALGLVGTLRRRAKSR